VSLNKYFLTFQKTAVLSYSGSGSPKKVAVQVERVLTYQQCQSWDGVSVEHGACLLAKGRNK